MEQTKVPDSLTKYKEDLLKKNPMVCFFSDCTSYSWTWNMEAL